MEAKPVTATQAQFATLIRAGNVSAVTDMATRQPELVTEYYGHWHPLHIAARHGHVPILQFFLDQGVDVNVTHLSSHDNAVWEAASEGHTLATSFLINQGGKHTYPQSDGVVCSMPLFQSVIAGYLDVVRVLVESGADFNTAWCNRKNDDPPQNALSWALSFGHEEIAEYLRSKGAVLPPDHENLEQVAGGGTTLEEHIAEQFGKAKPLSQQEVVPGDPPISIHLIAPASKRRPVVCITTGMSDKPMTVPAGEEEHRFAEVFIELAADWPTTPKKLASAQYGWPLEWLRRIARYPHDHNTWLGGAATVIANGDPPTPVADEVPFVAFLLLTSDDETDRLLTPDARVIHFYRLFPLYLEEYQFERKKGVSALLTLFQKNKIGMTYDPKRKNVARLKDK